MYTIIFLPSFERDLEKYVKKGGAASRLERIVELFQSGHALPPGLHDHQLHGAMREYRELHVEGDWLLVYRKDGKKLIITCLWLVSHKKLRERERGI